MGIVRDLYMARKIGAGLKLPAPTVGSLIKRLLLAKILYSDEKKTETGVLIHILDALAEPAIAAVVNIAPVQNLNGYSKPWIGTDYDQQPYNFRAVSSSSISPLGNSEMGNIVGGTVAWNQHMRDMTSTYYIADSSSTVSISDGVATVAPTVQYSGIRANTNNLPTNIDGHKMLAVVSVLSESMSIIITLNSIISRAFTPSQNWQTLYILINADSTKNKNFRVRTNNVSNFSSFYVKNCMVFDLTAMFGSTIADYLYGLESGTDGAGVAKLKSWGFCTKDYYAYDSGSLQSVNTSAHKTYKADSTLLGNYALDSSLTLRGIPKLDANNNLYYDGDSYAPDGTVTRKYGNVDLGTLTWVKAGVNPEFRALYSSNQSLAVPYAPGLSVVANIITPKYVAMTGNQTYNGANVGISITGSYISVGDSTYADADAFKSAMNGVYLVYKLATPTTESADPYTATQSIDPYGTEEYVDYAEIQGTRDVAIPVGHYTNYANICPITGLTGLSVYVSPTQDVADATTYAVDWTSEAGTVYGGTLDVVTGVLTVDRVLVSKTWNDGSDATTYGDCTRKSFSYSDADDKTRKTDAICNVASYIPEDTSTEWEKGSVFSIHDSSKLFYLSLPTSTSSSQAIQLCLYLDTPVTYQLTEQEVQMLLGENYIWSSSGDSMSVTYLADGNATPLESLNLMLGNRYSNPGTVEDVSDREALNILLGR